MKKKFFIGLFIFAAVGLFIFAHFALKAPEVQQVQEPALQAPIEIPSTGIVSLDEALKSNKPVFAMFYVDWCTYCRRFMPIFSALSIYYKDKFTFSVINCDYPENKEYIEKYAIAGFPTLYIIDKELDFDFQVKSTATYQKEVMDSELEKYLKLRAKLLK